MLPVSFQQQPWQLVLVYLWTADFKLQASMLTAGDAPAAQIICAPCMLPAGALHRIKPCQPGSRSWPAQSFGTVFSSRPLTSHKQLWGRADRLVLSKETNWQTHRQNMLPDQGYSPLAAAVCTGAEQDHGTHPEERCCACSPVRHPGQHAVHQRAQGRGQAQRQLRAPQPLWPRLLAPPPESPQRAASHPGAGVRVALYPPNPLA